MGVLIELEYLFCTFQVSWKFSWASLPPPPENTIKLLFLMSDGSGGHQTDNDLYCDMWPSVCWLTQSQKCHRRGSELCPMRNMFSHSLSKSDPSFMTLISSSLLALLDDNFTTHRDVSLLFVSINISPSFWCPWIKLISVLGFLFGFYLIFIWRHIYVEVVKQTSGSGHPKWTSFISEDRGVKPWNGCAIRRR